MLRQGRNRRLMVAGLAIIGWLVVGLTAPIIINLSTSKAIFPDSVIAAQRDTYTIDETIRLSGIPGIEVQRGTLVQVSKADKAAAVGSPATLSLPPNAHLTLENATISLGGIGGPAAVHSMSDDDPPLLRALVQGKYETLELKHCVVHVALAGGRLEPSSDVNAKVQVKRKGVVGIKGTARLRGRRVAFDLTISGIVADKSAAGIAMPLKLELKAGIADARFEGRLLVGKDLELRGNGDIDVNSGRELARWLGVYWTAGPGLQNIRAKGEVSIANRVLAFDKAVFKMDGNQASGALALEFGKERPLLSGTLAMQTLDATKYLPSETKDGAARESFNWASFAAGVLTVPLGRHLDADVRISAEKLSFDKFAFGETAAAISLRDGQLLADFAETRFGGGTGGGQITADFSGFVPRMTLRGKLQDVDLGNVSTLVAGKPVVKAQSTIVADLSSQGFTLQELLGELSGKVGVTSSSSGSMSVDLKTLAASAKPYHVVGWGAAGKGSTTFEKLDLKLVLRDGVLLTETAEILTAQEVWSVTGVLNMPSSRLDLRVMKSIKAQPPVKAGQVLERASVIELTGPWSAPVIRLLPGSETGAGRMISGEIQ
ncbi:MAG: AsmA-like C-terminal region-containing protein [Hyphomicrobiaceae bacterium]